MFSVVLMALLHDNRVFGRCLPDIGMAMATAATAANESTILRMLRSARASRNRLLAEMPRIERQKNRKYHDGND